MHLHWIDISIVVAYIVGITALGAWFGSKQKDISSYFVGDRNVHWFLVLISIVATETSTVTFLSVPGKAFNVENGNMTFLQLAIGYIIGRTLIAWILLPAYMRGDCLTAYELLKKRFDVRVQRTASGLFLFMRTLADGLRLFLASLLIKQFTGWDINVSILVLGCITLLYTYIGGMKAVIWTDLIQFFLYVFGAIVALYTILHMAPGGLSGVTTVAEEAGKLKMFDFSFDWGNAQCFWIAVIGGAIFSMASHGADQMMVQRYLCARNLKQARFSLIASGFLVFVQFSLFLFIGIGLFVLWKTKAMEFSDIKVTDEVFGQFIVTQLPTGVMGVVIASVLASAMSSLSSSLNSASSAFVNDFYKPLLPNRTDMHYLRAARLATLGLGFLKIGVALTAAYILSDKSVVDRVLAVAGRTSGVILGLFLLGQAGKPVRSSAALTGLVVGIALIGWVWVMESYEVFSLAWPLYAPIGAACVYLVALLANGFFDDGEKKQLAGR